MGTDRASRISGRQFGSVGSCSACPPSTSCTCMRTGASWARGEGSCTATGAGTRNSPRPLRTARALFLPIPFAPAAGRPDRAASGRQGFPEPRSRRRPRRTYAPAACAACTRPCRQTSPGTPRRRGPARVGVCHVSVRARRRRAAHGHAPVSCPCTAPPFACSPRPRRWTPPYLQQRAHALLELPLRGILLPRGIADEARGDVMARGSHCTPSCLQAHRRPRGRAF